jgi:membrane fusion protein (multidrug efflux system)
MKYLQNNFQQVLEKTFVVIVGAENKAEMKEVKIGSRVGSFFIVESGITANDVIVVEGLNKVQNGAPLAVEMVTAEQLQLSTNI